MELVGVGMLPARKHLVMQILNSTRARNTQPRPPSRIFEHGGRFDGSFGFGRLDRNV
jgi:hypothetical protein